MNDSAGKNDSCIEKIIIFALVMGITILNQQLIIEELKEAKL